MVERRPPSCLPCPELRLVPKIHPDQRYRLSDPPRPLQFALRTLRSVRATYPPGVKSVPNRHRRKPRESASLAGHGECSSLSFLLAHRFRVQLPFLRKNAVHTDGMVSKAVHSADGNRIPFRRVRRRLTQGNLTRR